MNQRFRARSAFVRRVDKLCGYIETGLTNGELRTTSEVDAAIESVTRWITFSEHGESVDQTKIEDKLLWGFASTELLEEYRWWLDQRVPLSDPNALGLVANPPWEYQEIFAVVAFTYALHAKFQLHRNTREADAFAAISYAEALEHWLHWKEVRGQARCRNPWDRMAELQNARDHLTAIPFVEAARSNAGKRAAAARHAADPKREAKQAALALWIERHQGKHPKMRTVAQFATEVVRRWPILQSVKVVEKWSARWTKDVKAYRTPSC